MQLEPKQFASAIAQICEEKGISREKALEIVETALVSAYRKDYGKKGQSLKVKFDELTGDMEVTLTKEVVNTVDIEGVTYVLEEIENSEEALKEDAGKNAAGKSTEDKKNFKAAVGEQGSEEAAVPYKKFNSESHLTLEEARKINSDAKIGDEIVFPMPKPEGFGRIAAQTAKQVILQRIREAEREAVQQEFQQKEGEVVSGVIQRIEKKAIYMDLGRAVGVIYPSDQIPTENYYSGMRIKALVLRIETDTKEPLVVLSRSHENFVKKLFEMEVPEVFSGAVEVKAIAREAGSRAKVAVASKEPGIDPIGSCIGQKGTRVQTVINELSGEKIDVIEYSSNQEQYIANAISPARVLNVDLNEVMRQARIKVLEDQLSLAIGKQGQNVRLAAKLTGWNIDVSADKKEVQQEEKEDEKPAQEISEIAVAEEEKAPEAEKSESAEESAQEITKDKENQ
ncbi:MAG: transcription termination factor NusA [bacterium]